MKLPVKILIIMLATLLCVLLLLYSVAGIVLLGPSKDASRMLLETLTESSATKFIPRLYMSEEKIEEILGSYDQGETVKTQVVVINSSDN